ncbi:MAG: TIR domain-containing protein [Acidobacteriota bacterium]|nr:TIR domain-containing protein [Acidobacteriota bacterium]
MTTEELATLIGGELRKVPSVEVSGLGTFSRDAAGKITLKPDNRPRIFVAYAVEDSKQADRIFADLEARGYMPWLDRRWLLPGQNWPRRIQDAIESSDFFIGCFSRNSVDKRGGFQAEVRYALDCATRVPLDDVFLIPARLDDCRVPMRIERETQYIDLFPDWERGMERIAGVIEKQRVARPR